MVAARDVILEVQKTNEEQARVIDARLYGAVRNLCEARRMDSRRFFALQQVLGLREIVRSLLVFVKKLLEIKELWNKICKSILK